MKTFAEYTEARLASAGDRSDNVKRMTLSALGLAGETGEYVDIIKKHLFHGKPLDRDHALAELGDVLWYLMYAADTLGSSLEEVATINDAKLAARYPTGFVKGGGIR